MVLESEISQYEREKGHEIVGGEVLSSVWSWKMYGIAFQSEYSTLTRKEGMFIDGLLQSQEFKKMGRLVKKENLRGGKKAELSDEYLLDKEKNLGLVVRHMEINLKQKIRSYGYPIILPSEEIERYFQANRKLRGYKGKERILLGAAIGLGFWSVITMCRNAELIEFVFGGLALGSFLGAYLVSNKKARLEDRIYTFHEKKIEGRKALDFLWEEYKNLSF